MPPLGVRPGSIGFKPPPAPSGTGSLKGITGATGPPPARGVTRAPTRGYGALAPPKPAPQRSVFSQPLRQVTAQNLRTGGNLQKLKAEGVLHEQHHQDFLSEVGDFLKSTVAGGAGLPAHARMVRAGQPGYQAAGLAPSGVSTNIINAKANAMANALVHNPGATLTHTFSEIPNTLNGMVMSVAQPVATTLSGHPDRAMSQFVHGMTQYAYKEYGSLATPKGQAEATKRYEEQGLGNPLTDIVLTAGGALGGIGRVAKGAVASREALAATRGITTPGKAAFDVVAPYREAMTKALQNTDVQKYLQQKPGNMPSLRTKLRSAVYESATQPRPLLRQSAGEAGPARSRGATLQTRPRSPNLIRAVGQTSTDALRRHWQQESLQRVMDARIAREAGEHVPRDYHAAQLAFDTKRGEVTPLIQRGNPLGGHIMFTGAERAQRIATSYTKAGLIRLRNAIEGGVERDFQKMVGQMSPEQRQLLDYAKEGHLTMHDAEGAKASLQRIHDNAQGRTTPVSLEQASRGMDVAAETRRLLDHVNAVGAKKVFTPDFFKLVEMIPDERLVSHANPMLQRLGPDVTIARKYGPQIQGLREWAEREMAKPIDERHPDAAGTLAATRQIKHLQDQGHEIRARAIAENDQYLHDKATDKFASAKNLADETARTFGLPTDRAYIQHTADSTARDSWLHTTGNQKPPDYRQWKGKLQEAGILNRDPELVFRAFARSLRDEFTIDHLNSIERDHAVTLPRRNMTKAEIVAWLKESGRDPKNYAFRNLGGMRQELFDWTAAEHLDHLNADPEAHQTLLEEAWKRAGETRPGDSGLSLIPLGVDKELTAGYRHANFFNRSFAKAKAGISRLMLGTSLPWATVMSAVTYPTQSMMGGAGPFGFLAHTDWYKGLSTAEKARFDHQFGVDDPYSLASHGISAEHMGSAQGGLESLLQNMKVMRQSPTARWLSKANPIHALIAAERIPRRYSRINVAVKGLRSEAIRQMVEEMRGTQVGINDWQVHLERLLKFGRLPPDEFMRRAMKNTDAVERIAEHLNNVLGEWHGMTQFERNYLNKYIMFYPWVRYSMKLAMDHLPTHHPLLYSLAYKLGEMQHDYLKELIGTEPKLGTIYLGPEQPNTPPAQRNFTELSLKQANPLLNFFTETLGKQPLALLDAAPPYVAALIEYMVGKNLFTGAPLKGGKYGESKEQKLGSKDWFTEFAPFMVQHGVVEPISPLRVASEAKTGGRQQAAGSLPLLGLEKPVQYSRKTENRIRREGGGKFDLKEKLLPFLPHNDKQARALQIRIEQKEAKEGRRNKRKEEVKKHKGANSYYETPGGGYGTVEGAKGYYETAGAGVGGESGKSYYEKP